MFKIVIEPRQLLLMVSVILGSGRLAPASHWIRPTTQADRPCTRPVWGVDGGIQIGIPPTPGPRGLIRIYTPYLHMSADRMINFVAVEPTVHGKRDLSEIEQSNLDHVAGKRIDAVDTRVEQMNGIEQMSLNLNVEPFDNGAHVSIKVTFRADHPDEVTFQTIAAPDSAPIESCVLTATMGNYAILRHLRLKDHVADARDVFANDRMGFWDFYPWHEWPASELIHDHGQLRIDVTGDDVTGKDVGSDNVTGDGDGSRPTRSTEPVGVAPIGWRYEGEGAEQSWFTIDRPGVVARVNGRQTYWGTKAAILGGVAFENVELAAPFQDNQVFTFRVTPRKDHH